MWCASSPHHVTSIFAPRTSGEPLEAGSIGLGLAIEPRLRACLDGQLPDKQAISTVERVARLLGRPDLAVRVRVLTPFPPGAGYAVSAAAAIAGGLVIAGASQRGVAEALEAAHVAEILEKTGLGDVLAISCGVGLVARYKPGAPGRGKVECFPLPGSVSIVAFETGRMHTSRLVSSLPRSAEKLAAHLVERFLEERSLEFFLEASERFSRETGLLYMALGGRDPPRVPGLLGFYAKKKVVVYVVESDRVGDAVEALARAGFEPRIIEASRGGPRVWWE